VSQVCDFVFVSAITDPPLTYPFKVWIRPDLLPSGSQNIANRAAKVQQFFSAYLQQPFPLKKQDEIAVSTSMPLDMNTDRMTMMHCCVSCVASLCLMLCAGVVLSCVGMVQIPNKRGAMENYGKSARKLVVHC
jgi:hypothetical protein